MGSHGGTLYRVCVVHRLADIGLGTYRENYFRIFCFSGQRARDLTLVVGTSTHAEGGTRVTIKRIVQHHLFNSKIDYDFSLLELSDTLEFSDKMQHIKLAAPPKSVNDGGLCLVTGWGATKNNSESRDNLRGAFVPIVNQRKCHQSYAKYGGITDRMICAGYEKGGKDCMFNRELIRM